MNQNKIVPRVTDILNKDEDICRTYSNICSRCGDEKHLEALDLDECFDCGQILGRHPSFNMAQERFQVVELYRLRAETVKSKK